MATFKSALDEIYETQNKVILFTVLLRTMVVFLVSFFIFGLFNFFYWGLSVAVAMIYFAVILHKEISSKKLTDIEKKNPFLAEKLRTASDYANVMNYVVSRLHLSVMKALKNVPISTFLDIRKITYMLLGIIICSGFVLFVASNDLLIFDLGSWVGSLSFKTDRDLLEGTIPNSLIEADIGVEELNEDAQINEIALTVKKEQPKRDLYLPEDIFEQSDKSFEEMLPKKKRIYIRKYFGEIRKYGYD